MNLLCAQELQSALQGNGCRVMIIDPSETPFCRGDGTQVALECLGVHEEHNDCQIVATHACPALHIRDVERCPYRVNVGK